MSFFVNQTVEPLDSPGGAEKDHWPPILLLMEFYIEVLLNDIGNFFGKLVAVHLVNYLSIFIYFGL